MLAQAGTPMQQTTTELYDSGTTQHLSPYCDHFINFVSIPPKPTTAAEKRTFDAIG
ncbi:hypothetical protein BS17DRAFT_835339 [Gyrodon lividus]|nr:hypothetical protein BS17DRAFT_835339 [Gyrodon lividus]